MNRPGATSIASFLATILTAGSYLAAVVVVLAACLLVFPLVSDVRGGEMDIPVSFRLDPPQLAAVATGDGAHIERAEARGALTFHPPSGLFLAGTAAGLMLLSGVAFWVLWLMCAVLRSVRDGAPFVAANATRIRRMAYVLIGGELIRAFGVSLGNRYAAAHFTAQGIHFNLRPDVNVLAIVGGLIILVIAEVFRAGTSLDEDRSLTI
jgi:hypothetical protein